MIKRQTVGGLWLLMPIVVVMGVLGASCTPTVTAPPTIITTPTPTLSRTLVTTPTIVRDTIPLGLNPTATLLNPGDHVVISVISAEWRIAELTWELDPKGFGDLSATTGPTVIYTAPKRSGTATVSLRGTIKGRVGSAVVSFKIRPIIELF